MNLYEKTLYLIDNRNNKITLKQLALETGVSLDWLVRLRRGAIANPSIHAIERIYTYLNGKGLDL